MNRIERPVWRRALPRQVGVGHCAGSAPVTSVTRLSSIAAKCLSDIFHAFRNVFADLFPRIADVFSDFFAGLADSLTQLRRVLTEFLEYVVFGECVK